MNGPLLVVVIAAGVLAAWMLARPPAVFVVRFRNGRAEAVRGKVTEAFLGEVAALFREFGLASAEVRGLARGRRISLWFSPSVPQPARQRLRNWWNLSGWSARPRKR